MEDTQELIPFIICFIICIFLLLHSYIREKKYKYSERSDYATINSTKRFGILITIAIICFIKIIVETIKLLKTY